MDHWRKLERQFVSRAFRLALPDAGKSSPAKMAMTAMTTRSSMSVKAHLLTGREPLATGEIPFTGIAFELSGSAKLLVPGPSGVKQRWLGVVGELSAAAVTAGGRRNYPSSSTGSWNRRESKHSMPQSAK